MANTLTEAVDILHKRIAAAQVAGGSDPEQVAAMIRASQQNMLEAMRKNPNKTNKQTGIGKK